MVWSTRSKVTNLSPFHWNCIICCCTGYNCDKWMVSKRCQFWWQLVWWWWSAIIIQKSLNPYFSLQFSHQVTSSSIIANIQDMKFTCSFFCSNKPWNDTRSASKSFRLMHLVSLVWKVSALVELHVWSRTDVSSNRKVHLPILSPLCFARARSCNMFCVRAYLELGAVGIVQVRTRSQAPPFLGGAGEKPPTTLLTQSTHNNNNNYGHWLASDRFAGSYLNSW